uniref:Uncharacterized protein n=1 Tax=Panagrolaimus davidi TaxID=227884 RepID=A0A914PLI3_9BILA
MKRINKFNVFKLLVTRFPFDAKSFVEYIEKNVNPFSTIEITLKGVTQEEREEFDEAVENELLLSKIHDKFKPSIFFMQEN